MGKKRKSRGKGKSSGFNKILTIIGLVFLVGGITAYIYREQFQSIIGLGNDDVVLTTPGAPEDMIAWRGHENITLTWAVPEDDGGVPVTGYVIFVNDTFTASTGDVLIFTVTGLTNGDDYLVAMAASNAIGIGDNTTGLVVSPIGEPRAPRSLTATPGNTHVVLDWLAPSSDCGFAITNYTIYNGTTTGGETLLATIGDVLTYNHTGLTNGVECYYKVAAVNAYGTGVNSTEESATPATIPSAPQNLVVTAGSGFLCANWTAPVSNGGSAITGYAIYRSVSAGVEKYVASVTGVSYNDTSYSQNCTRYYIVHAVNAVGNGTNSTEKHNTTWAVPTMPRAFNATAGNQTATLNWTAPAANGGRVITGYKVYMGTTSGNKTLLVTLGVVLGYVKTGLTNAQQYFFTVRAINSMGLGANATEASCTPDD